MEFFQVLIAFFGFVVLINCESSKNTLETRRVSDVKVLRQKLDIAHRYIAMVNEFIANIEKLMIEVPLKDDSKDTILIKQENFHILQSQGTGGTTQDDNALEAEDGDLIFVDFDPDTLTGIRKILDEGPDIKVSVSDIVPPNITDNKTPGPDNPGDGGSNKSKVIPTLESCTKGKYQFESDEISGFDMSDCSPDDDLHSDTQDECAYGITTNSNHVELANLIDSNQVTGIYGH
ncbi:hypothetical protein PAEPH01_2573, partial [Pancytospora epiphaga]